MRYFIALIFCFEQLLAQDYDTIEALNQSGAQYLQNVMDQLQHDREEGQSVEIMELTNLINMDRASEAAPYNTNSPRSKSRFPAQSAAISAPTPLPPLTDAEIRPMSPPAPALSSDELTALYNAAIAKGALLPQMNPGNLNHYNPAPTATSASNNVVTPVSQGVAGDSYPGYYYYYYPIKSFLSTPQQPTMFSTAMTSPTVPKPNAQLMETESKGMEPLFMAITGFIGMALMFIFSVLFLPKFGSLRSTDIPELKEAPNELAVLGKLIFESMDGKDCTERIACEVGRVVRNMRMEKVFKVMEIILPPNMSRQIGLIRAAAVKREKCNFIPCRFKSSRPPSKSENPKPWKKGPSPHDLWMKHFEKGKPHSKHPSNIWNLKSKNSTSSGRISVRT